MPVSLPRLPVLLAVILAALGVAGCQSKGEEFEMRGSPEFIYNEADRDLRSGNYQGAIQKLELLEARYPFSDPARQGQLNLMYAYYKNREAESAIDQADQFIRENPTHPRVDYAYYVRGLVHFEAGANWLERVFRADMGKRPPQEARKSFQSFQTLVQAYPKSPYAADARQRMVYLRNRLADYEIKVAEYYMKRGAYVGALNRARGVVETYDGAPAALRALEIAADAYRELGMADLALVAENLRKSNDVPDLVVPAAAMAGLTHGQAGGSPGGGGGPAAGPSGLRDGRWEGRTGLAMNNSATTDFEGGSTVDIEGSVGFMLGVAYHFNDRLQAGGSLSYDSKDYDASIVDDQGDAFEIKGSLDSMTLMFDAAYNFLTGPLTPFVAGGVGWTWVDTNVVNAPPDVACWWDPWYGYVCVGSQNTKTIDGLAYEVGVGLRYDFSDVLAVDGTYRMRWIDFENADGTPSFDGFTLNLGWKF